MAGGARDDEEEISDINVTPLVDVMMVLLVIFMVTANYIVNQSIDVNLPKADTGESNISTKNLAFVLDRDSQLYLDGTPLEFADVGPKIQEVRDQIKGSDSLPQALITADLATPHGSVVKLIDTVRKNGITEFAINVEATFDDK
jgi:biopolymer transport protein ExbD